MSKDIRSVLGPNPSRKAIIAHWNPEDPVFWNTYGKRIGKQNLYTSTWALMLSFVVWTLWATVAAKLNTVGFHFSDDELFTLAALPGLVGATGRLFYTYLPGLMGGKTSTLITTAILLFPIIGLGFALQDTTTTYSMFALLVSFIGIAGANFSASMANIGFFFPKAEKGTALGINAGIGNLGVSLIYLTAPVLIGWNLSSLFGEGLLSTSGTMIYLQNVCFFWTIPTVLTLLLIVFFMDNLPLPKQSPKQMMSIFTNKHTWLMCWIYTCGFGSFIGFSVALGLILVKEFPEVQLSMAAFLGPFIGAGIRPVGGWLADKINNGAVVTVWSLIVMLTATILVVAGIEVHSFLLFFSAFMLLFLATGFVNGASFRMIPYIFNSPAQSSLVTGFTAAIGAYGAFLIPKIFGWSYATFQMSLPALYILMAYTIITILITWYFYARKNSGIQC